MEYNLPFREQKNCDTEGQESTDQSWFFVLLFGTSSSITFKFMGKRMHQSY